jgi:hypothetical protein
MGSHAVVDFLGPPPVDVQQQAVQWPADQFGVGPVRERAEVGVLVVRAVDASVQQLLIAVHLISVAAATDPLGGPAGRTRAAEMLTCLSTSFPIGFSPRPACSGNSLLIGGK